MKRDGGEGTNGKRQEDEGRVKTCKPTAYPKASKTPSDPIDIIIIII